MSIVKLETELSDTRSSTPMIILSFIIFTFVVYKWLFHNKSHSNQKYNLPPSPPKLPILGNIHQLGVHPHRYLRSLSEKYGELMFVHLGQTPTLIVSSAKAATELMKTHDAKFSSRAPNKTANKLLYRCRNVGRAPYGEYWRQVKSIVVLQLLNAKRVSSFRSIREEEMRLLMDRIEKSNSSTIDLTDILMTLMSDIICRVAFGRKYSGSEGGINFKNLLQQFEELLGHFRAGDFIPFLSWIDRLNGWDAKVDKVAKGLDQFFEQVLKEHQDRCKDGNLSKVKDLVDVLFDVQEGEMLGIPIERDSIKAVILDMFSAGTDTTYANMDWTMVELLKNDAIMEELKKEVRGIAGERSYVYEEDIAKMEYLKAVIKETLRLHPSIPLLIPRLSTQDTNINGYDIPSGTLVLNNAFAIHRNPASWDNPEEFIPERFSNCSTDYSGRDFELIPFGAGRRVCPGITFAIANIELVLANLILKFDWTLPGGAKGDTIDTDECMGQTVHRKARLLVIGTPVHAHK